MRGTNKEIAVAANLFNVGIICCSKYGDGNQLCLQYFSLHGFDEKRCTSACHHPTILFLNSNGEHYEYVDVRLKTDEKWCWQVPDGSSLHLLCDAYKLVNSKCSTKRGQKQSKMLL